MTHPLILERLSDYPAAGRVATAGDGEAFNYIGSATLGQGCAAEQQQGGQRKGAGSWWGQGK